MPYDSDRQRRYFHAKAKRSPKFKRLAEEFDRAEKVEKGKKLDMIRLTADKTLIPVATGATGAIVANQFPQNQRSSKKIKEKVFKSANPEFNHEMAQKMYQIVMKMDIEEARLFSEMIVRDAVEDIIEKNVPEFQAHLNKVAKRRAEEFRKVLLRTVAKSKDERGMSYAQALDLIAKANAWSNPYTTGAYQFEESDFRRDPRSGRFQTKVNVREGGRPLEDKQAANLGIPVNQVRYKNLTPAERSQYQQEYMQVANFLNTVASNTTLGDHDVRLQVQDAGGNRYWQTLNGRPRLGQDWDPKAGARVIGVEARPSALSLGGAAFGLTNSLGSPISGDTAGVLNRIESNQRGFADAWTAEVDGRSGTAANYNRVKAGSDFLYQVAPYGSKAQIAARIGQYVGEYGPEAEKVFGPPTRKSAYRYRGTEKTPDTQVVRDYEGAVSRVSTGRPTAEQTAARTRAFNQAVRRATKEKAAKTNTPEDAVQLTRAERAQIMQALPKEVAAAPGPEAKGAGRAELQSWAEGQVAGLNTGLYALHLDAGNTPPSEGLLLDKNGKIVAQAVGYGDDHYLPFNLKNLAKLKGGEYIRTRSVGGPTSEDIYTGLLAGADHVTVVSRSGTFTIDFNEDFRGGRRYNDKAKRMVGRYEKLLDSIQSETIDKQPVPPEMRNMIADDVRSQMAGFPANEIRAEITRRTDEYKANPDLSGADATALENYIDARTRGIDNPGEKARIASQLRATANKDREYKYKLNGEGYEAALNALQEQFPYYIQTDYKPKRDVEGFVREKDRGYVEPGRNRPTEAKAGFHGTTTNVGQKFSASHADYQRGKYTGTLTPVRKPEPEAPKEGAAAAAKPAEAPSAVAAAQARVDQDDFVNAAKKIREAFIARDYNESGRRAIPLFATDEAAFERKLRTKEGVAQFEQMMSQNDNFSGQMDDDIVRPYLMASSRVGRRPYDPAQATVLDAKPFTFTGKAYEPGADQAHVDKELQDINRRFKPLTQDKSGADMTDNELKAEHTAVSRLVQNMEGMEDQPAARKLEVIQSMRDLPQGERLNTLATNPSSRAKHLEDLHRLRALRLNRQGQTEMLGEPGPQGRTVRLPAAQEGGEGDHRTVINHDVEELTRAANNPVGAGSYRQNWQGQMADAAQRIKGFLQEDRPKGPIPRGEYEAFLAGNPEIKQAQERIAEQRKLRGYTP